MARPPQSGPPGHLASQDDGDRSRDQHASEALRDACDEIERDMDVLRARYELYFLGIERVEPVRDRAALKQRVNRLLTTFTRNAGLRFRVQTQHARFISYERLWSRNSRAREEGTYGRDLFKARRRGRGAGAPAGEKQPLGGAGREVGAAAVDGPLGAVTPARADASPRETAAVVDGISGAPAAMGAAAQPLAPDRSPVFAAAPSPSRPAPAPPPRSEDPQLRALYDAYVSAKKRCNEDVSRLTYDAIAKTVAQQTPQLLEKLKAKAIDFKVVIQDGRAVLKAVPRG